MSTEPINDTPASPELRDYYQAMLECALIFPAKACDMLVQHHSKCVPGTYWTKPSRATDDQLRRATARFRQHTTEILANRTVQAA